MKKFVQLLMMMFPIVLGLSSCNKENELELNPLASEVSGMWYVQYDEEGKTFTDAEYTRVIQVLKFSEDGTGWWSLLFFDDEESEPIERYGGKSSDGGFTYTTSTDGTVTFKLGDDWDMDYYPNQLRATYKDGKIIVVADGKTYEMEHPSDAMAAWLEEMSTGGASADTYNINDEDFTPTTWREQEAIYIYDGKGQDATDAKGRTGYTLVNMPWYDGDVQSNLPEGFCNDITPGNGWEWVLNRCGSRNAVNNNFFAVYNKYTGTLRFFYYMPSEFSTGNDHVWQVSMTDHLAQQSTWLYGIPEDRTIVNKATLGQTGDGTYMTYITPWTNYMSDDGLITPNAGWWAFDIDLSQTRLDDLQSNDNIRLQMRSWNVQHTSLNSTMTAAIEGTFSGDLNAQVDLLQSQHLNNSAMGITAKVGSMVGNLGAAIYNLVSADGDKGKAFSGIVEFAKGGCNLAGIKTEGAHDIEGSIKGKMEGTITLGLSGNIDTEGTIRGSYPAVGVASPTIQMKDFDTKNSHFGQGVWNIKTSPVVYWTDRTVVWYTYHWYGSNREFFKFSPYFFDPNSIEIELNPNVFPTDQIDWIEVNSICGARSGRQPANDALRSAFGVAGDTKRTIDQWSEPSSGYMSNHGQKDYLWDFLLTSDNKCGMKELHTVYLSEEKSYQPNSWDPLFKYNDKIQGRGADGYAIEPQFLPGYREARIPFLEVNVTVLVKMKGVDTPIVLSRNYLPEIKSFDATEFNNAVHKAKPYASKMQGHTELYDYQMKRIYTILDDYDVDAVFPDGFFPKLTATSGSPYRHSYDMIFDGDWFTDWESKETDMIDGMWYVEFRSSRPLVPARYYMTASHYCANYAWSDTTNPYNWRLLAKAKEGDQWTTIATVTNDDRLPGGYDRPSPLPKYQDRVEYPLDVTGKTWQYFRLEILNTRNSLIPDYVGWLELAEFDFGKN